MTSQFISTQINQLYIGKTDYNYEHSGETHFGKDLRLINSDALGSSDQNWRIHGSLSALFMVCYSLFKL